MLEDERIAPRQRPGRVADGSIFVGIWIFHQDHADPVGPKLGPKPAVALPQTFIVAANAGARLIDPAAAGFQTVGAKDARRLFEFNNFENFAAKAAFPASFARNWRHAFLDPAVR